MQEKDKLRVVFWVALFVWASVLNFPGLLSAVTAATACEADQLSEPGQPSQTNQPAKPVHPAQSAQQSDQFKEHFNQGLRLAYNARSREDLEKAIEELVAARALDSSCPEVHYNLGLIYYELDEFAAASEAFEAYLISSPGAEDSAKVSALNAEARIKQQKLEEARRMMLSPSAWHLVETRPLADNRPSWFPTEFRQTKDGQLQVRSPRLNYTQIDKEAETKKHPWLPVTFRGRYFEYVVCLAPKIICDGGGGYSLIQGEFLLQAGRLMVVAREFAYNIMRGEKYGGAQHLAIYELGL